MQRAPVGNHLPGTAVERTAAVQPDAAQSRGNTVKMSDPNGEPYAFHAALHSGWATKLEGSSRFLNRAPTKREAQALGRERAMKDKVEHIIQNKDGQIGQRNSYGHDPRNVPG